MALLAVIRVSPGCPELHYLFHYTTATNQGKYILHCTVLNHFQDRCPICGPIYHNNLEMSLFYVQKIFTYFLCVEDISYCCLYLIF